MSLLKHCQQFKHLTLQDFTFQENRSLCNICGTGIKYLGKINHFISTNIINLTLIIDVSSLLPLLSPLASTSYVN